MLLVQEDARFVYCPFLTTSEDKLKFCQASMCMMWRWADPQKRGPEGLGYCGLAGRPDSAAS